MRLEWIFALIDRASGPARHIASSLHMIRRGLGSVESFSEAAENQLIKTTRRVEGLSRAVREVPLYPIRYLGNSFDEARARAERLRNAIVALGSGAAVGGAILLGRNIVRAVSSIEQERIALNTLLKSLERGENALAWGLSFADKTPFETSEVLGAMRRALAMGFSTTQVDKLLHVLGDTAAATGTRLEDLVMIFGQIRAAGRAASDELNQLAERAIPAWNYLAEGLGKSVSETKRLVERGEIDAATGVRALLKGMERDFRNMMAAQSVTINGLLSTIRSRPQTLAFELDKAKALEPIKQVLLNLVTLTDFSRPPGSQIREQLVSGLKSTFSALFTPLANATAPEKVGGLLEGLLMRLQRLAAVAATLGGIVHSAMSGFSAGFMTFINTLGVIWRSVQQVVGALGINLPQNAEGLARVLGYIVGLVAAWKLLNFITLGAIGTLGQFVTVGLTRLPVMVNLIGGLGARIAGVGVTTIASMGLVAAVVVGLGAAIVWLIHHWDDVKVAVGRVWNTVQGGVRVVSGVVTAIMGLPQRVLSAISGAVAAAVKAVRTGVASVRAFFADIGNKIVEGLKGALDSVASLGASIASKLIGAVKKALGIKSPSKAFAYVGKMSALGLATGLLSSAPLVAQAAETVSAQAVVSTSVQSTHTHPALHTVVASKIAPAPTELPISAPVVPKIEHASIELPATIRPNISHIPQEQLELSGVINPTLLKRVQAPTELPVIIQPVPLHPNQKHGVEVLSQPTVFHHLRPPMGIPTVVPPEPLLSTRTPAELPPIVDIPRQDDRLPRRGATSMAGEVLPTTRERPPVIVNAHISVNIQGLEKGPDPLGFDIARAVERHLVELLERAALGVGYEPGR